MSTAPPPETLPEPLPDAEPNADPNADPLAPIEALLHRWFVEYNPTYLFSAALVLAGLTLASFDVAARDALGGLGLSLVAEAYALALILGAALLHRLGHRRVAVMVGLLAALYQCDLTMHAERAAYLGTLGLVSTLVWIGLFHVKLRLLARALVLRPSTSALAVATSGAAVTALVPVLLLHALPAQRPALVGLALLALASPALWTPRTIESEVGFDYRGRRAIRGTWLLWAGAAALHLAYDALSFRVSLAPLAPVMLVLGARAVRTERATWGLALAALVAAHTLFPEMLGVTAASCALALVLRAYRVPADPTSVEPAAPPPTPYRGAVAEPGLVVPTLAVSTFSLATAPARERLLLGALAASHLAAWATLVAPAHGLGELSWREHVVWLDVVLAASCVAWALAARRARVLAPIVTVTAHAVVQQRLLPHSLAPGAAGALAIVLGFAMLVLSLAATWWHERRRASS